MSGGLPPKAGGTRFFLVFAAVALAASLLVSLFALAPHLHSAGLDAVRSESETQPSLAEAIDSAADADNFARRVRAHLDQTPRDARGWVIYARLRAETDDYADAAQAYERALALPSKVARDPTVWCEFADALGMMQGGRLAGRPRELIDRALALNPNHPKALEMAGSAEFGQGDYASALRFWRPLLAMLEPGSRAYAEMAAAIARTEHLAATGVAAKRH